MSQQPANNVKTRTGCWALSTGFLPANTLTIAILLTTLFIFMTIGAMTLIVQSSLNVSALESATRASYAAESGLEIASFWLRDHQPGFQATLADIQLGLADLKFVEIEARTPCLPKGSPCAGWNKPLSKLEAATIPLFYDKSAPAAQPKIESMQSGTATFALDFASPNGETPEFQWTIFDTGSGDNESITGCVGPDRRPSPLPVPPEPPPCDAPTIGQITMNSQGKYNQYVPANDSHKIVPNYPVSTFLNNHTQAFMTIQNTSPTDTTILNWRMKYDSQWADDKFIITATGQSGSYEQTQRAEIPLGEFLPFFHFAIFSPGG